MKRFEGYMKGVDLGGWLSQRSQDKDYLDSFISEEDIKVLAGWGIDHVRLPVDYEIFQDEEGKLRDYGFPYVDKAIAWCEKYGLNLILDLHKTAGYVFDDPTYVGFFESEEFQERFYQLWEEFARRYGNIGSRVAFELLNEVTDPSFSPAWNRIIRTVIGRIRAIAPEVKILVGGYWNNSVDALKDLEAPYDENVIYNFHCYDPLLFTHQGAYWVEQMDADYRIPYPGDIARYRADAKALDMEYMADYSWVADTGFDKEYFLSKFRGAVELCEERGAALYCGEYGVIEHAAPEDVLRWYKDIHGAFEEYGIGRAAWSYKEVDFGLSDPRLDGIRDELVKYL